MLADLHGRNPDQRRSEAQQGEGGDGHVEGRPAEGLAQPGGGGDPGDVGHGQPDHHRRHRSGPAIGRDQRRGHDRGDAEVGAVRDSGYEAGDQQRRVRGGQGRGQVAEGEHRHQGEQQLLARQPSGQRGDHRCADDDAERVRGDQVTRRGDVDPDPVGDLGQQTHGGEFGGPDREGTDGQCEERPSGADGRRRVEARGCQNGGGHGGTSRKFGSRMSALTFGPTSLTAPLFPVPGESPRERSMVTIHDRPLPANPSPQSPVLPAVRRVLGLRVRRRRCPRRRHGHRQDVVADRVRVQLGLQVTPVEWIGQ